MAQNLPDPRRPLRINLYPSELENLRAMANTMGLTLCGLGRLAVTSYLSVSSEHGKVYLPICMKHFQELRDFGERTNRRPQQILDEILAEYFSIK